MQADCEGGPRSEFQEVQEEEDAEPRESGQRHAEEAITKLGTRQLLTRKHRKREQCLRRCSQQRISRWPKPDN